VKAWAYLEGAALPIDQEIFSELPFFCLRMVEEVEETVSSLLSLPIPLEVGPLNPARESEGAL